MIVAQRLAAIRFNLRVCSVKFMQYKSATQQAMRNALLPGTKSQLISLWINFINGFLCRVYMQLFINAFDVGTHSLKRYG